MFALLLTAAAPSCARRSVEPKKEITPEYDQNTGRLRLLKYDSNGNGVVDTWSYMDGSRVMRIEVDTDEDGKIDRWEYYGADQQLEKVGLSSRHDGQPDTWQYFSGDQSVSRLEISTRGDGKVTRIERFDHGHLMAAEEDTDADGRIDKWEIYAGDRLTSVAFDTRHRGAPDRRLVYDANGTARVEIDPDLTGHFVAANPATAR